MLCIGYSACNPYAMHWPSANLLPNMPDDSRAMYSKIQSHSILPFAPLLFHEVFNFAQLLSNRASYCVSAGKVPRTKGAHSCVVAGAVVDCNLESLELIATSAGSTQQGFKCIYCSKLYTRKYGLKIHLRTHTGFKPLKCKVCCRAFGDPSNLNKHQRLHVEQGSLHKCRFCGKLLLRKEELRRHLASRHSSRETVCIS